MARQLPTVDIKETGFYVDIMNEQLRQCDDASNRISFNAFDQDGNGYTFLFDKVTKNTPKDLEGVTMDADRYEWITLPALMELDPLGIALKYNIPVEILCPEMAADSIFNEEDDDDETELY